MSEVVKHRKPAAFYDVFERKGPGQKVTHYCPGCGHGTAHKLIAEAIDHLGIGDRVVFCSPVGCGVFAYYYFNCGNIQCAHGRAPAVATGIRRSLSDAIVICYQGDGDLAAIGTGAIIHAANRGENISVFFINNAIYGMTGGQMAPTTLVGQKTTTTPMGRSVANEGNPIGMAEVISALKTPVFVERVSLGNPARVLRARRAIRKALQTQAEKKGFSFVEILSPCPVGWKMSPVEAREWLMAALEPVFPVQSFRDVAGKMRTEARTRMPEMSDEECRALFRIERDEAWAPHQRTEPLEDQHVKIAGFGGQGVMAAGVLLANCALAEGVNATWLPSYGPEMRGGTANASVIVSQDPIGAPVVDNPNVLVAMNRPSLDAFERKMRPGGLVVVNTSLIERKVRRDDVRTIYIPATDIAKDAGLIITANIAALSAYVVGSGVVHIETLRDVIPISIKKKSLIDVNLKAVDAGLSYVRSRYPDGV
jgi:2-oxoisovalerate ferredoxin oxidoreductase beta subunit